MTAALRWLHQLARRYGQAMAGDGQYVVTCTEDGRIDVWDAR